MSSRPQATPAKLSAQDPEHRSDRTCKREAGFRSPVWESMAKALGREKVLKKGKRWRVGVGEKVPTRSTEKTLTLVEMDRARHERGRHYAEI